ncbi:MAG: hypothetical protein ACI4RV_09185, partial [Eubacteriales bacterium]
MKKVTLLFTTLIAAIVMLTCSVCAANTLFFGFENDTISPFKPSNISTYSVENGILTAECTSTDPILTLNQAFSADDYSEIRVRMRHELNAREDGSAFKLQVFYTGTDASGKAITLSEANSISYVIAGSSDGAFITYSLPLDKANLAGA